MSDPVQIVYISRSTFKPMAADQGIGSSVARIPIQSRLTNVTRGLVGALYFDDECLFQSFGGRSDRADGL